MNVSLNDDNILKSDNIPLITNLLLEKAVFMNLDSVLYVYDEKLGYYRRFIYTEFVVFVKDTCHDFKDIYKTSDSTIKIKYIQTCYH